MPATTVHLVRRSRAVLAAVLCAAGLPVAAVVTASGAAAAGPSAPTAYVVNTTGSSVSPVDTTTNQAGAAIPVAQGPIKAVITPDGCDGLRAQRSPLQRRDADRHRDQHARHADPRALELDRPRDVARRFDRVRRSTVQVARVPVPSRRSTPRRTPLRRRSPSRHRSARARSRSRPTARRRTSP